MTEPRPADCPPTPDLERMLADDLPPDRARAVETHVSACAACQAELERLTDTPSAVGLDLSATRTGRAAGPAGDRPPAPLPEVPGYEIVRELGRGGMGVVYLARQVRLNRLVALKMILAGEFASAEVTRRFLAEAEVIARISHPNIVQVFDFGDVHGRAYFAMEYVAGGTLADRLVGGAPWPPREAARLIEVAAGGLHRAHQAGVIHRDLKPANILIQRSEDRGQKSEKTTDLCPLTSDLWPKIADFGVAKLTEGGGGLTLSQALIGSPNYMSPEQAAGRSAAVGPASDVHALGAVLYELLTGRKAFDGATALTILEQVKGVDPPPSRLARGIPRDLETICRACLEKDPARRYATAALLAEDLRRFREGETILARPVGRGKRLARWARRHPVESGLVAALFLALGLGLLGTSWKWREAVRERNAATVNQGRAEAGEAAATEARVVAEAARRAADEARDAWQRITSEAAFARGDYLARRGDVAAGLLWMHDALRTAPPDDPHWEVVVRRNLAGWDARLHTLKHVYTLESPANTAALSPDGSLLLAGGAGGQADLVDTATGRRLARLPWIGDSVECVAFSPDGTRAVVGGERGVRVVDVARRRLLDGGPQIAEKAFRCAFSPDGRRLLTSAIRRAAILWDLDTGREARRFDTGTDDLLVWSVAFAPDGRSVALGLKHGDDLGAPAEVLLWPVGADRPAARLPHRSAVLSVRFHPKGEPVLVTACADGRVRLWDPARGQLRGEPLPHPHRIVEQAAFTPDGRAVVTACTDGLVRWWDAATGRPLGSSLRHDGSAYGVAFDGAGRLIASHSADHTVRLWSVAPAALPGPAPLSTAVRAALADDGSRALFAGNTSVRFRDAATGGPVGPRVEAPQGRVTPIAVGPGGRRFAVVDESGVLQVWEDGDRLIRADLKDSAHGLAFDPTGDRLAVVQGEGVVRVWDVPARKPVHTLRHSGIAWTATFDPAGRRLAVGSSGAPAVRLWDLSGPEPTPTDLPIPTGVDRIVFRPDGRAVVTKAFRTARLWDPAARAPLGPDIGPFDADFRTAFSPDGGELVSWCGRQVRLWDPATGAPRAGRTFDHAADVSAVAVDPAGRELVAALADRTAQFWDLRTGRPVGPPVLAGARPLAVGWAAATGRFLAAGDDGRVYPLAAVSPATGSVADLGALVRRRTGYQLTAGTVSPLLPKDWAVEGPSGGPTGSGPTSDSSGR